MNKLPLGTRLLEWHTRWKAATTPRQRRDVLVALIDSSDLCHYRRLDAVELIFGDDLEPYRLNDDGSGEHIVYCVAPTQRDIGGWEVGEWYLIVRHSGAWGGSDLGIQRVSDYWISNHSGKHVARD